MLLEAYQLLDLLYKPLILVGDPCRQETGLELFCKSAYSGYLRQSGRINLTKLELTNMFSLICLGSICNGCEETGSVREQVSYHINDTLHTYLFSSIGYTIHLD